MIQINNLTESVKNKKEQLGNLEEKISQGYVYSELSRKPTHIIQHVKNYKVEAYLIGIYKSFIKIIIIKIFFQSLQQAWNSQ